MLQRIKDINSKISQIIKIDINYLMRGATFLTLTQLTSAVFGFLLTIVFARYLPQEIFGTYRYILAAYALLLITSLPGLDTAVLETLSKGNQGAFKHAIKTKFIYGFIGTGLSIVYGLYHLYMGDATLFMLFLLIGIFLPFIECLSLYTSLLNAQKKFGVWAITELTNQIFSTLTMLTTVYLTDNIFIIISAYFIPYILVRLIATIYTLKKYITNENFDPQYLAYGKTMTWYQIITRGIASIDQMVLFHFMGPVQVAIFSIATAIPQRFQGVLKITGVLAFPKYANREEDDIKKYLPKKMIAFGAVIFIVCCLYALIAPTFFRTFFPSYNISVPYSQLAIFFTLSGLTYPFGAYLNAHKKIKENYMLAILSFTVKILCLIILVPLYGIWGAIWGILLSSWSTIVATFYLIYKQTEV